MKSAFDIPRITRQGSLRRVSAAASEPLRSDRRLKKEVEAYDEVLPRLVTLSNPDKAEGDLRD